MLTSFYQVSSAVMELWQKSFFLEEDDDELEMAYHMVCLQPNRPVYHGRFSMTMFMNLNYLPTLDSPKRERERTPFTSSSMKKNLKNFYPFHRQQCMQSTHLETSSAETHCSSEPAVQECCTADHYLPTLNCCIFSTTQPILVIYASI